MTIGGVRMTGIPKEEAIKYFEDMKKGIFLFNGNWLFDMAIEALRQELKWIPISERLPEEMGTYITTVDYGKHGLATGQRYYHGKGLGWEDDCVTAWMPLPAPYKAQESEI